MADAQPFLTGLARALRLLPRPLAPDGLPFPSSRLIQLVAGTPDQSWFWEGGRRGAQTIDNLLEGTRDTAAPTKRALDFGCGCGRVLRHFHRIHPCTELYGSDYNPQPIRWCRRHLPFCHFSCNTLHPPIQFPDDHFDLVYAFSVITHLSEPLQKNWLAEFRRIIRAGGFLILSTHGDYYREQLTPHERSCYDRGELVVRSPESAGGNRCAAFHPPAFVHDTLAPTAGFTIRIHLPEGALGNPRQDAWLLQRAL